MSQKLQILKWLKSGKTLTALQALEKFGCWRLAARVREIREEYWRLDIRTIMRTMRSGKRVAVYRMI